MGTVGMIGLGLLGSALADRLLAAGYGEHDPIAKNATPEGRRENRRIEIILLPDLSELPTLPEDMATQVAPPKPDASAPSK